LYSFLVSQAYTICWRSRTSVTSIINVAQVRAERVLICRLGRITLWCGRRRTSTVSLQPFYGHYSKLLLFQLCCILLVINFAYYVITHCGFLLCVPSSLERTHSVSEAPLSSVYYVCQRIWNCLHSPICLWLIAGSISVTFPSASRYRVCAWKHSLVALIYLRFYQSTWLE